MYLLGNHFTDLRWQQHFSISNSHTRPSGITNRELRILLLEVGSYSDFLTGRKLELQKEREEGGLRGK